MSEKTMTDMYLGLEVLEREAQRLERNGQADFAHALRRKAHEMGGALVTIDAILEDAAEASTDQVSA
ncbi:hypothetical protein KZO85_00160 [Chromohalobacter canadensis]|uniref:hypothetical protein n=1 Tax=Chromohalobacter canadensis TaxID=141389 RepID=UPI0021BE2E16|nr:hypothetical protein [Chromohalobacter canadensis]MCT8466989.1 hypothetical protein [Chromohalobacter canadensis]